jgi:hypothetical protein
MGKPKARRFQSEAAWRAYALTPLRSPTILHAVEFDTLLHISIQAECRIDVFSAISSGWPGGRAEKIRKSLSEQNLLVRCALGDYISPTYLSLFSYFR